MSNIGHWLTDKNGLPCFEYTGKLPYKAHLSNGRDIKLPEDPWFLLGNYQLTLFTHISGEYELITGQRSWGRMNQGKKRNSGINCSSITIDSVETALTGMKTESRRVFGCGFAEYSYKLGDVKIKRNISVKPSTTPYNGVPAFLLTVSVHNGGSKDIDVRYRELITANYEEIRFQTIPKENLPVQYGYQPVFDQNNSTVRLDITGNSKDPLCVLEKDEMSMYEAHPPSLFLKDETANAKLMILGNELSANYAMMVSVNETKIISMIIGYAFKADELAIDCIAGELSTDFSADTLSSAFAKEWISVLPRFENEHDTEMRRELIWHAYNLEAMATYSEFYQETKIPQGTIYDYDWGMHASARDNFQHALPLVYYNPALAKSTLKYMLKRTTPFGEIRLIEFGVGCASNQNYNTSDQQLFFFLLLSEYLRVTKDYEFLKEPVTPFPAAGQTTTAVISLVKSCFLFLRDEIGVGPHGLVKLLNSDWNDTIYYIVREPYNRVINTSESHMNSAMAISILQNLIEQIKISGADNILCASMKIYRENIFHAFNADLGERTFPRRMYFAGKPYGDDNMFLEPQGYTLLIDKFSDEWKKTLYSEMQKRVYCGEKLGAREQQAPEFEDAHYDKGSRENGGFWWALNGPVIMGISKFNKPEAMRLLKNMMFNNYAKEFPDYWTSYWSASDNIESSLIPEEGLPDQSETYASIPVYCAHPHAWIVYCYYYINEG